MRVARPVRGREHRSCRSHLRLTRIRHLGLRSCGWNGWLRPGDRTGGVPPCHQVAAAPGSHDVARSRWNKIDGRNSASRFFLSAADRIDFLVGRVGVEVKIGQPRRQILRQLERYAGSDRLDELLLVSSAPFPSGGFRAHGKPVFIVSLSTGWM